MSPACCYHQSPEVIDIHNFPGLYKEVENFLIENKIENIHRFSKKEWKSYVSRKINQMNWNYLIESSRKYKKLDYLDMANEEYKMKDYFFELDLSRARMKFQERASTVKYCSSHFPSDESFLKGGFFCPCEDEDEEKKVISLFHWKKCSLYSKNRESKTLSSDFDLMSYYLEIINIRAKKK